MRQRQTEGEAERGGEETGRQTDKGGAREVQTERQTERGRETQIQ